MMEEKELLRAFVDIRRETLHIWIERGWLSPEPVKDGFRFREIDIARLRLIVDFRTGLDLGDDALDVVLPLIDQVHGLRRQLHRMSAAVSSEPADVRSRISRKLEAGIE